MAWRPLPYSVRHYSVPPGAGASVDLWSTVTDGMRSNVGIHRLRIDIAHDQAGTFNFYKSDDGGVNWRLLSTAAAVAPATTTKAGVIVEGFADYRLQWVNGGTPQTYFESDLSFHYDRSSTDPSGGGGGETVLDDLGTGEIIIDDLGTGEPITA